MKFSEAIKAAQKAKEELRRRMIDIAEEGTLLAVEKATDLTPPSGDDISGTKTRTGALKQAWANDSITKPAVKDDAIVTYLKNGRDYASYVNDGHRMDRHFVPGLIINPYNGLLEKVDDPKMGGIMVGTRTAYVPGKYMAEAAEKTYSDYVIAELTKAMEELKL